MLFSVDDQTTEITVLPYAKEFKAWASKLTDQEYEAVKAELRKRITGGEVHTSSWIPGEDWTETDFQPIYEKACGHNNEAAAKCFGLFLWEVMMEHPDRWSFGRFEKGGVPIKGLTYFRI